MDRKESNTKNVLVDAFDKFECSREVKTGDGNGFFKSKRLLIPKTLTVSFPVSYNSTRPQGSKIT